MDQLAKKMNIKDLSEWYSVTWREMVLHGAATLLLKYNGSPRKLLQSVYPEYQWDSSKFHIYERQHPIRYWDDVAKQRSFMDDLAKQLKLEDYTGWYSITGKIIQEHGGGTLLSKYNGSPSKLLPSIYPEYPLISKPFFVYRQMYAWDSSKFHTNVRKVRRGHWNSIANQRMFLTEFAKQHRILPFK